MALTLKKYESKLLSLNGFVSILQKLNKLSNKEFGTLKDLMSKEVKIRKKIESTGLSFE